MFVIYVVKQHRDVQETPSLKLKMKNYFIASQDKDLRMRVGSVPGIPIIYLNKVTLVLEPPSQDSRDFSKEVRLSCA
jgi:rRNA-processing protein FCF1